jgi:uncharacterized protein YdeI (YjbR/CyaY-like superfamily)
MATFFASACEFRDWLKQHHESERELWVGFYKKSSGQPSLTWPESIDEALCFGWIDGVRKRLDEQSYKIRFTPRKARSNWSTVNLARAQELIRTGRMTPAGLRAYEARVPYAFEQKTAPKLSAEAEARFRANASAWEYFHAQPPGYQSTALWWVVSAKREETRARRLETLIEDSAARRRIGPFRRAEEP